MTSSGRFDRRRFLVHSAVIASALQLQRAALALGFAPHADVCKLSAEQEVGPFYVAGEQIRSNIAEDKPGIPLSLRLAVLDARTCKPLSNAAIDLWHCDALGLYAGYTAQNGMGGGPGGPPPGGHPPDNAQQGPPAGFDPRRGGPPPAPSPTDKRTFLRGIQLTAADGSVNFRTIFPGFYQGRTNHIHFKVRIGGSANGHTYAAGHTSHTGQVFFPEADAATLMQLEPYVSHNIHRTTPSEDDVFTHQHGDLFVASLHYLDPANPAAGLHAELIAAVDPTATPAPVAGAFGGPPPRS